MQTSHVLVIGPLSRSLLAFLTFTLPTACVIEDVIITPDEPDDPRGGVDATPGPGPDPSLDAGPVPDANPAPENPQAVYYDLQTFALAIQPAIDEARCMTAGCHALDFPVANLGLYSNPELGSNEMWFNLQVLTRYVRLETSPFSAADTELYVKSIDRHGIVELANPEQLLAWIDAAAARYRGDDGALDPEVFASNVQPILDAGCALSSCHSITEAFGGFGLHAAPTPGSPEMEANLRAVARLVDLSSELAEDTLFYRRATDRHGGSDLEGVEVLQAWIQAGLDADEVE